MSPARRASRQASESEVVPGFGNAFVALARNDLVRKAGEAAELRPALFDLLKNIAGAIVQTFGREVCEVVIHDLADLEHSIVWIEGSVTQRRIGGPMTDLGLEMMRAGRIEDVLSYRLHLEGKALQSSSVFLRDQKGRPWGAFCINFNVTPLQSIQRSLDAFRHGSPNPDIKEQFSQDIEDTLHRLLVDGVEKIGKPLREFTREERLSLIRILEQKGAFLVRRSVPFIAKQMHVTRYTVYNYLAEIRGGEFYERRVAGARRAKLGKASNPPHDQE
jgi:predicted transcriptional regulator YheO